MIDSITVKNFETHLDTAFNLDKGVNVIVGESDEGKSGIIRAITWNTKNRPRGDSYRNDQLSEKKKKDKLKITDVGIIYKDSGLVIRARDGFKGGVNHYQINNEKPLRALGTDVPNEIQDVTRMKSVNIQGQHPTEQYFLLADKPGQVAKELNKVSGLTIMDKATADINSQIRICNAKIKLSEKEIKRLQEKIDDTEWVDKAEKFANKLKYFKIQINSRQEEYDDLNEKITGVFAINDMLEEEYGNIDAAIRDIAKLQKEAQDIIFAEHEQELLNKLILAMKSVDKELKSSADTEKALKALEVLKTLQNIIDEKEKKRNLIKTILFKLTTLETAILNANKDCKDAEEKYKTIRREEECPTCGRTGK